MDNRKEGYPRELFTSYGKKYARLVHEEEDPVVQQGLLALGLLFNAVSHENRRQALRLAEQDLLVAVHKGVSMSIIKNAINDMLRWRIVLEKSRGITVAQKELLERLKYDLQTELPKNTFETLFE